MTIRTLRSFGYAVALMSCLAGGPLTAAGQEATLYDRLGGQPAVTAVASGLVDRILLDSRVNAWFAHAAASPANTAAYKAKLYDPVVEDLVAVLDTLRVPAREKGELLGLLGPLKTSIVQP